MSALYLRCREIALRNLSIIMVGDMAINKLDLIAVISFHGNTYFNVFRRYNNVYEIVFEDLNGDFFTLKDDTVSKSLQQLLCLSDEQMSTLYTKWMVSFKHNGPPPTMYNVAHMSWTEIQQEWYGITIDFGGVLDDYHADAHALSYSVASSVLNNDEMSTDENENTFTRKRKWEEVDKEEEQEEQEEEEEQEEQEENKDTPHWLYTILRSGTKIFKGF